MWTVLQHFWEHWETQKVRICNTQNIEVYGRQAKDHMLFSLCLYGIELYLGFLLAAVRLTYTVFKSVWQNSTDVLCVVNPPTGPPILLVCWRHKRPEIFNSPRKKNVFRVCQISWLLQFSENLPSNLRITYQYCCSVVFFLHYHKHKSATKPNILR